MTLYITEKPSQVSALGDALASNNIKDYRIIALAGHFLALNDLKDYGIIGKWDDLVSENKIPFIPQVFEKKIKPDSKFVRNGKEVTYSYKDRLEGIKEEIENCNNIIIATDPDNEGATLALELIQLYNAIHKVIGMINMSKLDLTSLSKEVNTIDKIPYFNMYQAGDSRAAFDWSFGMNATILATTKFGNGNLLNLGGVKLPTIRMVVERDKEFETFKEIPYFTISAKAKVGDDVFSVKIQGEDERFTSESLANDLINELKANGYKSVVSEFSETKKSTAPSKPYSLTDLQAAANRKFKYTASETLEVAQKLYQDFKVQSYPRTDSNYYAEGEFESAGEILRSLAPIKGFENILNLVNVESPLKRKIFDDSKIEAHTALSPLASITLTIFQNLSAREQNIFSLVASRYAIQFMNDYKYLEIKGKATQNDVNIVFGEKLTLENGFKTFEKDEAEEDEKTQIGGRTIPILNNGDIIEILEDSIEIKQGFTKPRPRFKEASLLLAMEKVSRFFEDKEVKEHLGDGGIGTPSTRAKILEELKTAKAGDTPYFELNSKGELVSTSKARYLINTIPSEISSPVLRAKMESKLKEIVKGTLTKEAYLVEVREIVNNICSLIASSDAEKMEKKERPGAESGELVETPKTYRLGDKFIFKTFRDKAITKAQAKKILEGSKVKMKLKSKAGKDYEMNVFLKDGKLDGEFVKG